MDSTVHLNSSKFDFAMGYSVWNNRILILTMLLLDATLLFLSFVLAGDGMEKAACIAVLIAILVTVGFLMCFVSQSEQIRICGDVIEIYVCGILTKTYTIQELKWYYTETRHFDGSCRTPSVTYEYCFIRLGEKSYRLVSIYSNYKRIFDYLLAYNIPRSYKKDILQPEMQE